MAVSETQILGLSNFVGRLFCMEKLLEEIIKILDDYCCRGCDGYQCNRLGAVSKEETARRILELLT